MTAPGLATDVVTTRLERIVELVGVLYELDDSLGTRRVLEDMLLRLALERALTRLVDVAVSINEHVLAALGRGPGSTGRASFEAMAEAGVIRHALAERLGLGVSVSNVLAGDVVEADWDLILGAVPDTRYDYQLYVREVSGWLAGLANEGSIRPQAAT